ncbi:hypothetical protein ES703_06004 [subsurface metagenome]
MPKLLAQMDAYDWDSVEDIAVSEDARGKRARHFKELIYASGIELDGSILDVASGITSLAYSYPDTVAVDNDPQKIKRLRKDGVKAILADIESLPFEEGSFDYVVSISPPLKPMVFHKDGYVSFGVDQEWNKKIVDAALRIARKQVLIASYFIALHPPHDDLIEKKGSDGLHWVLYKAPDNSEI